MDEHEGEYTETSIFVCHPIPQDPGCYPVEDTEVTTTVASVLQPTTTAAVHVDAPRTLPHTGMTDGLSLVAVTLISLGLAFLRQSRIHTRRNTHT